MIIDNSLTNSGVLLMRVWESGSTICNDSVNGLNSIGCGGTIELDPQDDPLSAGDRFRLFQAAAYTGASAEMAPAAPGLGLAWNVDNLAINGALAVAAVSVPTLSEVRLDGSALRLNCAGGQAGAACEVLSSTNLSFY